jgi:hypothetical protein
VLSIFIATITQHQWQTNEKVWKINTMILTGRTEVLTDKAKSVPVCPPQNPRGLAWDGTQGSKVTGLQLTTQAMVWLEIL